MLPKGDALVANLPKLDDTVDVDPEVASLVFFDENDSCPKPDADACREPKPVLPKPVLPNPPAVAVPPKPVLPKPELPNPPPVTVLPVPLPPKPAPPKPEPPNAGCAFWNEGAAVDGF